MRLVKYARRQPTFNLFDDMSRLFDRTFIGRGNGFDLYDRSWTPAFNIRETADQYNLEASLPGLSKKDIEVTLSDGVLAISGERRAVEAGKDETILSAELRSGSFYRAFTLPVEVDEKSTDATYKDGILSISVKKIEPVEPERRKIAIE